MWTMLDWTMKKGQEKEKFEDKGMKTLTEVREAEIGGRIYGMENKGKERLNRAVKRKNKRWHRHSTGS